MLNVTIRLMILVKTALVGGHDSSRSLYKTPAMEGKSSTAGLHCSWNGGLWNKRLCSTGLLLRAISFSWWYIHAPSRSAALE